MVTNLSVVFKFFVYETDQKLGPLTASGGFVAKMSGHIHAYVQLQNYRYRLLVQDQNFNLLESVLFRIIQIVLLKKAHNFHCWYLSKQKN